MLRARRYVTSKVKAMASKLSVTEEWLSPEEVKEFSASLDQDITTLRLQGARFTFAMLIAMYYVQTI